MSSSTRFSTFIARMTRLYVPGGLCLDTHVIQTKRPLNNFQHAPPASYSLFKVHPNKLTTRRAAFALAPAFRSPRSIRVRNSSPARDPRIGCHTCKLRRPGFQFGFAFRGLTRRRILAPAVLRWFVRFSRYTRPGDTPRAPDNQVLLNCNFILSSTDYSMGNTNTQDVILHKILV